MIVSRCRPPILGRVARAVRSSSPFPPILILRSAAADTPDTRLSRGAGARGIASASHVGPSDRNTGAPSPASMLERRPPRGDDGVEDGGLAAIGREDQGVHHPEDRAVAQAGTPGLLERGELGVDEGP